MKKILSLTLAAIMLLSTLALTSCDAVAGTLIDVLSAMTTTSATSSTEPTPDPEPEIIYTITKEEWLEICKNTNYTIDAKMYGEGSREFWFTPEAMCTTSYVDGEEITGYYTMLDGEEIKVICDAESNKYIGKVVTSSGFLGVDMGYFAFVARSDWEEDFDENYQRIAYDEETHSYWWGDKTSEWYEWYFENGKLLRFVYKFAYNGEVIEYISLTFKDIGTTVVNVPEYTFVSKTEVTAEQWQENLNQTNYRVDFATYGEDGEVSFYVTENGCLMVIYTGEVSIEAYASIVDGEEITITYDSDNEKWVGTYGEGSGLYTEEGAAHKMGYFVFGLDDTWASTYTQISGNITYVKETGSYRWVIDENSWVDWYFEYGTLVKAVVSGYNDANEVVALYTLYFFDIGNTVVNVPDYELVTTEE